MNAVTISDLRVLVRIGCGAAERIAPQRLRIDLVIETDFTELLATGDLASGIDYSVMRRMVKEIAGAGEFVLLEHLADVILKVVLENKRASAATITIQKLERWRDAVPGIVMTRRNT